jgi:hypothetical protein
MKKIILTYLLCGVFLASHSQVLQFNVKTNTNRHAAGSYIKSLSDSSSIIAGYTYDLAGTVISNPNVLLFKVDKKGQIVWQKEISGVGNSVRNFPIALEIAANGDILLATYSQSATYSNTTGLIYRFTNAGVQKWKKVIRLTNISGSVLFPAGELISGIGEMPDGRLVLIGQRNVTPSASQSMLMVLTNTNSFSTPNIQYTEVYDVSSSDGFGHLVMDGYNCYIAAYYYEGGGPAYNDACFWKYNLGTSASDLGGTIVWRRVIDFATKNPITGNFSNQCNGIGRIALRGDKLISSSSTVDAWSPTARSSEVITLDTNGNNFNVRQFVSNQLHANSAQSIPVGSSSFLNFQSPATKDFDNSTLGIGDGSIVPNTKITRTDLAGNQVTREINLTGNQSVYEAFNQGTKLDLVGCNDNDSVKSIYVFKTFLDFEDMNQNGCELKKDTIQIINLNPISRTPNYTKINGPFYFDYSFDPPVTTPNLTVEIVCGSLCKFGTIISQSTFGSKDTLFANIIGVAINPKYKWSTGDTTSFCRISTSGTYSVTVTDSLGCESVNQFKAVVSNSPCLIYKDFTWTNTGNSFKFKTNPLIPANMFPVYSWKFGNGKTSDSSQPTTNFLVNGTYLVSLKYCLRDSQMKVICCDSITKPVKRAGGGSTGLPCFVKANFIWTTNGNGTYQFYDLTLPLVGQMYTYEWDFGDGTTSVQKNPNKLYATNGVKKVCLRVKRWLNANSMYCEDTFCKTISVSGVPPCNRFSPNFTWSFDSGTYNMSNLTNMSGYTLVSVGYTVSNGSSFSVLNPKIAFAKEGNYSITMTMTVFDVTTGLNCTKSITKHIYVANTLCGCFKAHNYVSNKGLDVSFKNSSFCTGGNTNYLYKFGNGDTSHSPNPDYTYSTSGMYRTVMYINRTQGGITCEDSFVRILYLILGDTCSDTSFAAVHNYPCPTYLNPVCGCDSITYPNYCHAEKSGVKQYTPGPCSWDTTYVKLCGNVYIDLNKNCAYDTTDVAVKGVKIDINSTPLKSVFTNDNGFYYAYFHKGNYAVTQNIASTSSLFSLYQLCPAGPINIAANTAGTYCNLNFYDTSKSCPDLGVSIAKLRNLTPGFLSKKLITYVNYGATAIVNAKLHYRFLSGLNLPKASTTPTYTVSGNVITWNLGTIPPYNTGFKTIDFETPVSLALGTVAIDSVWIEPSTGDCRPNNNSDVYRDTCIGSYDPNDKQVKQSRLMDTSVKTLDYHIRFQNTGTAPAHNVRISDVLDNQLDMSTLKVIASSHAMYYFMDDNKVLTFDFPNIMLPDSGTDFDASQGFVSFSINRKPNLPIGSNIKNTAAIYFDFNDPIITNTTENIIVLKSNSGVQSNASAPFFYNVFPNPTTNLINIEIDDVLSNTIMIDLFDIHGRMIFNKKIECKSTKYKDALSLEGLGNGIYILNIDTDGKKASVKIVKE